MIFLIEYDREQSRLESLRRFDDSESLAASRARLELEVALTRSGTKREVVLLEAASEDDIRRTHRRYFAGIAELTAAYDPSTKGR